MSDVKRFFFVKSLSDFTPICANAIEFSVVAGPVALVSKVNGQYFPDEVSMRVDSYNKIIE